MWWVLFVEGPASDMLGAMLDWMCSGMRFRDFRKFWQPISFPSRTSTTQFWADCDRAQPSQTGYRPGSARVLPPKPSWGRSALHSVAQPRSGHYLILLCHDLPRLPLHILYSTTMVRPAILDDKPGVLMLLQAKYQDQPSDSPPAYEYVAAQSSGTSSHSNSAPTMLTAKRLTGSILSTQQ